MSQTTQFIRKQTVTLLRLGVSPADVERSVSWVDKHMPDQVSATTWIPTEAQLREDGLISESAVMDARNAFYQDRRVPRKYKRLLDAREVA